MSLRKFCSPTAPATTKTGEANPLRCSSSPDCSHHWYFDFRMHGRRYRQTTNTANKQEAKKIEARDRSKVLDGHYDIRRVPDVAFSTFAATYLQDHAELNKRDKGARDGEIVKVLNRVFGSVNLREITAHRVEEFKRERLAGRWRGYKHTGPSKPIKPGTVNRELNTLRAIFTKAIEWGHLREHPMRTVKRLKVDNRRTRILSPDEQVALVAACPKKMARIVRFALITGARIGEVLALAWQDVLETELVFLETKNGKARRVPINDALRAVLAECPRAGSWVFTNARTQAPYTVHGAAHVFRRAVVRAGILTGDVSLHTLRHTALSRMIAGGLDDHTVMAISGHATTQMLSRYTHPTAAHKLAALDTFNAVMDGQRMGRIAPGRRSDARLRLVSTACARSSAG